MSKPQQVLILDPPHELVFKGPFTEALTTTLKLTNPSNVPVCFKVKTTAPKDYCVRPNAGIVRPNSVVNVSIILHVEPVNEDRIRHKFMVQSAYIPDYTTPLEVVWKNTPEKELMDTKLRVIFDWAKPELNELVAPASLLETQKTQNDGSRAEYMKLYDEKLKLQDQVMQLEAEVQTLKERLGRAPSVERGGRATAMKGGATFLGFSDMNTLTVALIVIVSAALFGFLFRLF